MSSSIISGQNSITEEDTKQDSVSLHHQGGETVVIDSSKGLLSLDLANLWFFRELLYFLALRDIKLRYKQTFLGVAWVLLQPIATTLIFTLIFRRLGQSDVNGVPYLLFAFSGFIIWTFVNTAIMSASNSLINNTSLITKTYFPRLLVPIAALSAHLPDLILGIIGFSVALFAFDYSLSWKILLFPLFLLQTLVLTFGAGVLLAALNVKFRDVKQLLPFALQLWLFISPIFYSVKILPSGLEWLWRINPLTGILDGLRSVIFGHPFDFASIFISVVMTTIVTLAGIYIFKKMEDDFADII